MIPDDWRIERLADLVDYSTGRTPSRDNPEYWNGSGGAVPWVSISDMKPFGVVRETREQVSGTAFQEVFGERCSPAGTLLMSFKLTIGRVATLGVDACHNEAIISLRPNRKVEQRFLGYFLSQVDYAQLQDRQVKGNTLNQEKINRIPIALPSLDEQLAIADVLDLARSGLDVQSRAVAASQRLKVAVMSELFTRGLRGEPQIRTDLGLAPEGWVRRTIGSLGRVVTGTTPPTRDPQNYSGGTIPFVSPGDFAHASRIELVEKKVTSHGLSVSRPISASSVCVVCIGSTIGKVGLTTAPVSVTNQQINSILPGPAFLGGYLFHIVCFWSDYIRGFAAPSPVPILSKGPFEKIEILTSLDVGEQREIAEILDAIDRKIDLHKRKRVVLEKLFNALLNKLMTGEIRVADLDLSALDAQVTAGAAA